MPIVWRLAVVILGCSAALAACSQSAAHDATTDAATARDGGAGSGSGSSGAPVPFQALHTYYIAPDGSDGNPGTSAASAWATPNHAVDCGDVIIAEPGAYNSGQFQAGHWGAVANCPSTSGGIDGSGGIYFSILVCGGSDMTSCTVDGGSQEVFRVDASSWAVEGFAGTQAATANQGGFATACFAGTSETSATLHHIAFINNIASGCDAAGFDTYSFTSPGGGVDQFALVGAIAYNAAPSQGGGGICGSGISLIPVNGSDASAGTHIFVAGAFSYDNINAATGEGCNTDGEGLIFDSWGIQPYTYQAVAEQNAFWGNGGPGFEAFPQGNGTSDDAATIVLFDNTAYGDYRDPKHVGAGELMLNQVYPTTASYTLTDNIFEAAMGSSAGGTVYGATIACRNGCPASVLGIHDNYLWNSHAPTTNTPGGTNTEAYYSGADQGSSFPWGSNAYSDPGLANPSALPSTAPSCAGYANTTACMLGAGVATNLTPSGGATGKGYHAPGACAADAYYPAWLKGIVYLKANGADVTENGGLITKPCDL